MHSLLRYLLPALLGVLATTHCNAAPNSTTQRTFRDCPNCPEMVVIPTGSFTMGTLAAHRVATEVPAELEPQRIRIERAFALGRYEVTRAEYAEFAAATGRA
jgi:formylglycine-generating enzyme required for sulfatase activity